MKIVAIILSCLVLALSAGAGRALPQLRNQTAQAECCCKCGCCDDESATENSGTPTAGHHGQRAVCPFCAGSFAKGLNASYYAVVPPVAEGSDADKSLYISRVYVPPFVGGIWQPPKTVCLNGTPT